jgi:hypothetical protein
MVASAPCTTPAQSDHVMLLQNNGQQDYTVPMQDKQELTISEIYFWKQSRVLIKAALSIII